jgi:hypothetical protein
MAMSPVRLNTLYENARHSQASDVAWNFRIYKSDAGEKIARGLKTILSYENIWSEDNLDELRMALAKTLTYSRTLLASDPDTEFWSHHLSATEGAHEALRNYLPDDLNEQIRVTVGEVNRSFEEISNKHAAVVLEAITSSEGLVLLVPELPRLGHLATSWVSSLNLEKKVRVLTNKGDIRNCLFEDYQLVIFPGAPSRFLARPGFDVYLRALLLAGLAPRVQFIAPSWSASNRDASFGERLLPGLELRGLPTLKYVIDPETIVPSEDITPLSEFFDANSAQNSIADFEAYEPGGEFACRFIFLGKGLAYPVEEDSKRVSVLLKNAKTGDWEPGHKHPFDELEPGDIIVASVDRSEIQANRDRAAREMGEAFKVFEERQIEWKSRLSERAKLIGLEALEQELKRLGVKKYRRVSYWWLPDAIQPNSAKDFKATLEYLSYSQGEANVIMELANSFDGNLIKAGRSAGLAISNSLDELELTSLENGLSIELTLEDFGDASYLLAPVVGVSGEEVMCRPSQIRRVISVPAGAE